MYLKFLLIKLINPSYMIILFYLYAVLETLSKVVSELSLESNKNPNCEDVGQKIKQCERNMAGQTLLTVI